MHFARTEVATTYGPNIISVDDEIHSSVMIINNIVDYYAKSGRRSVGLSFRGAKGRELRTASIE